MTALRPDRGFDALLLAGGASSRMGRDKALLPLGDGRVLWQRQMDVLRALKPGRLFFSGPARAGLPGEVRLLSDPKAGLGPLSGIVEGLRATEMPLLVVLAVDLPAMTSAYLKGLLRECRTGCGCVPKRGEWFEPLAAVYPREALALAEAGLASEDRSLQSLVEKLLQKQILAVQKAEPESETLFANWNEGERPEA